MPQSGGGSRASMGTDYPKGSLPSGGAPRRRAGAKASALKALARLLARQAAREVLSSSLPDQGSTSGTSQSAASHNGSGR
jgi:hypothetical protein